MKLRIVLIGLLLFSFGLQAQQYSQSISGTVIDEQAAFPLPGVTVMLLGSDPLIGTSTDIDGRFTLENVPIGRHSIGLSYIGYEDRVLSNLLVSSGKQTVVDVSLEEAVNQLNEVVVTAKNNKHQAINELATVSARSFTVEEASRFSGTLNDPAKMAANFAGVSSASDARNDIVIRGNSPTGVLWRMEGIDIPSPNHFATFGTTGGPVSMLNINNLKNSDFMTGAFTAEYGNATAGVFDLQLRNGNDKKHEFLGQIGFNGFEFGAEGPLSIGRNSSYIANARYSTLEVINLLGFDLGVGAAVPQFKDVTFKVNIPTESFGRFSVFGIGGMSDIAFKGEDSNENDLYGDSNENSEFESRTGIVGFSHLYFRDKNTYSKLVMAVSGATNTGHIDSLSAEDRSPIPQFGVHTATTKYSLNYKINRKINARNTISVGLSADHYKIESRDSVFEAGKFNTITDFEGNAQLFQSYMHWQHRFSGRLSMVAGFHMSQFYLNGSKAFEPRLGVKYELNEKASLNFGAGLHSQLQPLPVYFTERESQWGYSYRANEQLDFTRSRHLVLAYDQLISPQLRFKGEVYYQNIKDAAVDSASTSFSMLNAGRDFTLPDNDNLVNGGKGQNYGVELTLEKFFSKNYYFLSTVSLFESTYEGSDGVQRSTAFDGNLVANLLAGKEFSINEKNAITLDTRLTYALGNKYTALDLEASRDLGLEVRQDEFAYEERFPDYFRHDFKIGYRRNGKRITQTFSVDLQNLTNRRNIFLTSYDNRLQNEKTTYQRGFFPNVEYKVLF